MVGEGLGDGEGATKADDGGATGLRVVPGGGVAGAAAAGWLAPRVSVSPMASPVTVSTAAKTATPDRKLIASKRAFIARLIRSDQPLPSLTT